jgi:hypothetical protein
MIMAKRKKGRKKKASQPIVKLNPESYIRKRARNLPVYECLIDENWRETQFTPVIVSRQKASGRLVVGTYVVDMQCLGIKNSGYYHDMARFEYEEFVQRMAEGMNQHFVKIDPTLCFNIIYGSVEFAEDCGFQPHKDFGVSEYILDDVDTVEYMEVPLGKDGKPFYFAGPYDDSEKIMAILRKNVGEGNFHYLTEISPDHELYPDDIEDVEFDDILEEGMEEEE